MQFLALTRRRTETFSETEFTQGAEQEAERVRTLYERGVVRNVWRRGDRPGACFIIEASTENEVRDHLATLPFAKAGMLEIMMVLSLQPYHGFGPRHADDT